MIKKVIAISIILIFVLIIVSINAFGLLFILEHTGNNSIQDNNNLTIQNDNMEITLPSTYEVDEKKGIATDGDVEIRFSGMLNSLPSFGDYYKAVQSSNNSGYTNVSVDNINEFKVYQFAVITDKVEVLTYNTSHGLKEYAPVNLTYDNGENIKSDHYRRVFYRQGNSSVIYGLTIITDNPKTDLYTTEINNIVNSISVVE